MEGRRDQRGDIAASERVVLDHLSREGHGFNQHLDVLTLEAPRGVPVDPQKESQDAQIHDSGDELQVLFREQAYRLVLQW